MRLDDLGQDLRFAWRGLGRAKAFTSAAVLTLALGIAGTTLMLTLIQGVLLRPLPVRDQEQLIVAWKQLRAPGLEHYPFGDRDIEALGRESRLLDGVAGVTANGVSRSVMIEDGVSSDVTTALVTGGFFAVLGVEPLLGRAFTRADDQEGAENVVVISHGLWQRRYGGRPDVLGRRIRLGDYLTIVGVMPPDLDYPAGVEIWRTTRSVPTSPRFGDAARQEIDLIARRRAGVTIEQATSELVALTRQQEADAPRNVPRGLVPVVRSFEDVMVGDVRTPMLALLAAVGLVLVIASANVANLLLMRGEARRTELAIRGALGAGRGRLVRQLLAESAVLTGLAGMLGLLVTWWSLRGVLAIVPDGLPRVEAIRIDATVVLFTIVVALITSMLAGLVPALSSARLDLLAQLRSGGRGVTGPGAKTGRRVLVVAQVALAVTIVAAAGLVTRSVLRLQVVDLGLTPDRLVIVDFALPQAKYADRVRHGQFLDELISGLEAVPAIAAATPINVPPFAGDGGWDVPRFTAEGQTAEAVTANPSLNLESIHPSYFATLEVRLVRGRAFTDADRDGALAVTIVSEDVAARTWPGEDPIGKRLKMGGLDSRAGWLTVVGVASLTRYRELMTPLPTLYMPAKQFQMAAHLLALRTSAPIDLVASIARDRISAVDPDVRVTRVVPFARMLDAPLARPRFNAFLLGLFAVAALLLSTIGLYAVMAAWVRQRDREIALRVALGATSAGVRRLVLTEVLWLAGTGAAIGLAIAVCTTRVVSGILFDIDALDPSTLAGAALLLIAASALASYVPLRRATRLDTVAMLRSD
jgi:putative ABC transport system permease protein